MAELKDYAIGSLTLLLLVSFAFNVVPDATHLCRALEITKSCDRLSSTENTCYPTAGTMIGKKFCSSGWELILKDAAVPETPAFSGEWPAQYLCDQDKCTQIR